METLFRCFLFPEQKKMRTSSRFACWIFLKRFQLFGNLFDAFVIYFSIAEDRNLWPIDPRMEYQQPVRRTSGAAVRSDLFPLMEKPPHLRIIFARLVQQLPQTEDSEILTTVNIPSGFILGRNCNITFFYFSKLQFYIPESTGVVKQN